MSEVQSFLISFGFGAIISNYFTSRWQRKNKESEAKQSYKETRYKCIVLLMKSLIDFERSREMLNRANYNISKKEELKELLKDEQLSSLLYASKGFIKTFGKFITEPNQQNLVNVVNEMRKDLWGIRSKIEIDHIA